MSSVIVSLSQVSVIRHKSGFSRVRSTVRLASPFRFFSDLALRSSNEGALHSHTRTA